MISYLIKKNINEDGVDYNIYDSLDIALFSIVVIGKKRESKLVLETIDSKNVILYLNGYTDTALKFTYSVKNEEDIEILKITKDQFTLCLNISGLFGNLKVRRIKSDIREFNITKDGALIGKIVEINTFKSRPLKLEVYDEYFTIVLLAIYIIVDIQKYYGEY